MTREKVKKANDLLNEIERFEKENHKLKTRNFNGKISLVVDTGGFLSTYGIELDAETILDVVELIIQSNAKAIERMSQRLKEM